MQVIDSQIRGVFPMLEASCRDAFKSEENYCTDVLISIVKIVLCSKFRCRFWFVKSVLVLQVIDSRIRGVFPAMETARRDAMVDDCWEQVSSSFEIRQSVHGQGYLTSKKTNPPRTLP